MVYATPPPLLPSRVGAGRGEGAMAESASTGHLAVPTEDRKRQRPGDEGVPPYLVRGPGYKGLPPDRISVLRPGWDIWRDGCPGGESPGDVGSRAGTFLRGARGADRATSGEDGVPAAAGLPRPGSRPGRGRPRPHGMLPPYPLSHGAATSGSGSSARWGPWRVVRGRRHAAQQYGAVLADQRGAHVRAADVRCRGGLRRAGVHVCRWICSVSRRGQVSWRWICWRLRPLVSGTCLMK
jgi:hypothetical protein